MKVVDWNSAFKGTNIVRVSPGDLVQLYALDNKVSVWDDIELDSPAVLDMLRSGDVALVMSPVVQANDGAKFVLVCARERIAWITAGSVKRKVAP